MVSIEIIKTYSAILLNRVKKPLFNCQRWILCSNLHPLRVYFKAI